MADVSTPVLEVKNLTVRFRAGSAEQVAVDDVSLSVSRGETLVVLGESGSGKSVTASAIMDILDRPPGRISGGSVVFEGRDILPLTRRQHKTLNGRRIAIIFQDPLVSFNPVFTVGRQIAEVFEVHGIVPKHGVRAAVIALLEHVGIADAAERVDQYPHQFSGGQRQRLMIAMAVALNPNLIIADEPTTALDVTVQLQILSLLKALQKEHGMAIMLITHDLAVAAYMADRIVVMKQGRVVESGPAAEILRDPSHPYTRSLLSAAPRPREAEAAGIPGAEPLLRVRGLTKRYQMSAGFFGGSRSLLAVNDVSFDLNKGEVLGIVGESGSGKSTIARTLLRMDEPSAGSAEFMGKNVFAMDRKALTAFRQRVQLVFQDPFGSLNPKMKVLDLIAEPMRIREGKSGAHFRTPVCDLLERVGLDSDYADRYPHQLSGGQCQRVAIARALISRPDLIVFDEAVSALDALVQVQVVNLLSELRREFNLTYIFITHDLHLIRNFSDRILVMKQGKIVEMGETAEIFARPQAEYTATLIKTLPRPGMM